MDIRKIRKLIELINETGVNEIEVKSGDDTVRISRFPTSTVQMPTMSAPIIHAQAPHPPIETPSAPEAKASIPEGHNVKSPMVGTVYLASTPGSKPFISIGQRVSVGDTLCLIEAMAVSKQKMFSHIFG